MMDKQTEKWAFNYLFIRELTDENCNKSPFHQLALCLSVRAMQYMLDMNKNTKIPDDLVHKLPFK